MTADLVVVIPTFNEGHTIADVIQGVLKHTSCVVVVDDGSIDLTDEQIKDLNIDLIKHPKNMGKSASLVTGFKRACELGAKAIITIDADGQHDPTQLPKFIQAFNGNPKGMALGARTQNQSNYPRHRLIGTCIADFFITWAGQRPIIDSQSGFKCYPIDLIKRYALKKRAPGFTLESYLLIKAAKRKIPITYIEIEAIDTPKESTSHYRPTWHTTQIVLMITWEILKGLFCLKGLALAIRRQITGKYRHVPKS